MRAKHGTTSFDKPESMNNALDSEDSNEPQMPVQSPQHSSVGPSSRNGIQFQGVDSPNPINFGIAMSSDPFSMFLE